MSQRTVSRRMFVGAALAASLPWRLSRADGAGKDKLVIHEWGTFTVLQDEAGEPVPGVNVNEESLPSFVHRLDHRLAPSVDDFSPLRRLYSKGLPPGYPAALLRMETPVIYIYPPASSGGPISLDVSVRFRGGWISEWYPNAEVAAPGFKPQYRSIGKLTPETEGRIEWRNLLVDCGCKARARIPKTDEHVWLAPRISESATVSTGKGQSEGYLFYRGVASLQAPLRVTRGERPGMLAVRFNREAEHLPRESMTFAAVWLVDIRPDRCVAYRQLGSLTTTGNSSGDLLATIPSTFTPSEYAAENLLKLRAAMRQALVREGLYEPEAEAMLNTWEASYFKSPGLRLFFTLPRNWTDSVLPLDVSKPAEIERVMIGRIELVTPEQRKLLRKLAAGPVSGIDWLQKEIDRVARSPEAKREIMKRLWDGKSTFGDYAIKVSADYRTFLDLGRFREALVLHEVRRRETDSLKKFVQTYRLRFMEGVQASHAAKQ